MRHPAGFVLFESPARRDGLAGIEPIDRGPGRANHEIASFGNEKGTLFIPIDFWAWVAAAQSTSSSSPAPETCLENSKSDWAV